MKKHESDGFEEIDLEEYDGEPEEGLQPEGEPADSDEQDSDEEQPEKAGSFMKEAVSFLIWAACVLLISFLLVHFVIQRCDVGGSSMVPTLTDGDQLLMDKISYRFKDPERFDIIVFGKVAWPPAPLVQGPVVFFWVGRGAEGPLSTPITTFSFSPLTRRLGNLTSSPP